MSLPPPPRRLAFRFWWHVLSERPRLFGFAVWFTVIPLIAALPLAFGLKAMQTNEPDHAKISRLGRDAFGKIERIETVTNETMNNLHPRRVYFTFPDAAGRQQQGFITTFAVDRLAAWLPGDSVNVRVLGEEATIPELPPDDFPWKQMALMPLFFMGIGLPLLGYILFRAQQKRRVVKWGVVTPAKLLALTPVSAFGFGSWLGTSFEATYSFLGSDGVERFGRSLTKDLRLLNEKRTGDPVEILVGPEGEKRTVIVDSLLAGDVGAAG